MSSTNVGTTLLESTLTPVSSLPSGATLIVNTASVPSSPSADTSKLITAVTYTSIVGIDPIASSYVTYSSIVLLGPVSVRAISFNATAPLTTIFTPSPSCGAGLWTSIASTQGALTCNRTLASTDVCYPGSFFDLQETGGIYQPGVCPDGYTAARAWTVTSLDATTSICCPYGMEYNQPLATCVSSVTTATEVVFGGATSTYSDGFTACAPTLAVAWASSDLALFVPESAPLAARYTAAPSTTTSVMTSASPTSSVSTSTPTSSQSPTPTPSGLSSGAIAGVAVGVILGVISVAAISVWMFWRRRRARKGATNDEPTFGGKAELPGEAAEKKVPELGPDVQVVEVSGHNKPGELGTGDLPAELDSGWHGHEAGVLHSPR